MEESDGFLKTWRIELFITAVAIATTLLADWVNKKELISWFSLANFVVVWLAIFIILVIKDYSVNK